MENKTERNMAFKIIRNDITKVKADAIVNTANPLPVIGQGTDRAVYYAAGKDKLLDARKKIGTIERGKSAWTHSFNLEEKGIKYIIHTAGIAYRDGKSGETDILRSSYSTSLNMAKELGCKSVAIPLLATGFYSFPKEIGLQIAVDEISRFLIENEIDVSLVVYDGKSYLISQKLFDDIRTFIDENYIDEHGFPVSGYEGLPCFGSAKSDDEEERIVRSSKRKHKIKTQSIESYSAEIGIKSIDVDSFILQSEKKLNFQNTLQHLIAERNLENATVYTKALIDRKFFSKIISNKDYIPKKMTVMALGLALELSLEEYEGFLASAGYAFMPSSRFDVIIKYCIMNGIYNLVEVDMILYSHDECCFAPE